MKKGVVIQWRGGVVGVQMGLTETSRRGVGFMSGCGGGRATNSCTQWLAFLHLVFFPVAQWDSWVSAPQAVPSNPQLNQQLNQP